MKHESNSYSFEKIRTDVENELTGPVMMKNVLQTNVLERRKLLQCLAIWHSIILMNGFGMSDNIIVGFLV